MDLFEGQAMQQVGAQVSLVFVPPRFVKAAVIEAVDARLGLCVVIPRASRWTTLRRSGPTPCRWVVTS